MFHLPDISLEGFVEDSLEAGNFEINTYLKKIQLHNMCYILPVKSDDSLLASEEESLGTVEIQKKNWHSILYATNHSLKANFIHEASSLAAVDSDDASEPEDPPDTPDPMYIQKTHKFVQLLT